MGDQENVQTRVATGHFLHQWKSEQHQYHSVVNYPAETLRVADLEKIDESKALTKQECNHQSDLERSKVDQNIYKMRPKPILQVVVQNNDSE